MHSHPAIENVRILNVNWTYFPKKESSLYEFLPNSDHDSAWRGCYSLLTPLPSLLAFGRSAASGLPCAGAPPPQRPLSYNLAPQRVCGQYESWRPAATCTSPRVLAGSENVPVQPRQARQLPNGPNLHHCDHQEPAIETVTVLAIFPDSCGAQTPYDSEASKI